MKQIKYKIVNVPAFGSNFMMVNVPAFGSNFREDLKRKDYLYIQDFTIDEFLEYNPPCKECIVQATCLHNSTAIVTEYTKYLYLKMCNELKVFITYDKGFYK